jgi:hypothetical protein
MRAIRVSICILACAGSVSAQSLPPIPAVPEDLAAKRAARVAAGMPDYITAMKITEKTSTSDVNGRILFPLWDHDSDEEVKGFYGTQSSFIPVDQVQFLYGFGAQKKGLAADFATLIFPKGWRVSAGMSVTSSGGSTTTVTTTTTTTTGTGTSASSETVDQAIERLRAGGDMYITAAYPLAAHKSANTLGYVFFLPKLSLLFNGFGGQQTLTEATEYSSNFGVEGYWEVRAIQGSGRVFLSGRYGLQTVSATFKTAAHLDKSTYPVAQVALGAQLGEFLRISLQRFQAPPGLTGATLDDLSHWHLVLQLSPNK